MFQPSPDPGRRIHTPPGGPPEVDLPSAEIFAAMGPDNIRAMITDFYNRLAASPISNLFPADLSGPIERSALYFIQLLGGPAEYSRRFGPPRLRARHLPFVISEQTRRVWLECFFTTLEDAPSRFAFPPAHLPTFRTFLTEFSAWMVNSGDPA